MKIHLPFVVVLVARVILGSVLIIAGWDKITDPATFARAIDNYHILPYGLENSAAIVLPWLEVILGISIIIGFMVDGAAGLSLGLMIMFITAIIIAILRGYNIECGCGLRPGEMVGVGKVIEDLFYIVMCVLLIFRSEKRWEIGTNR